MDRSITETERGARCDPQDTDAELAALRARLRIEAIGPFASVLERLIPIASGEGETPAMALRILRRVLVNPTGMAPAIVGLLPASQTPFFLQGLEGFYRTFGINNAILRHFALDIAERMLPVLERLMAEDKPGTWGSSNNDRLLDERSKHAGNAVLSPKALLGHAQNLVSTRSRTGRELIYAAGCFVNHMEGCTQATASIEGIRAQAINAASEAIVALLMHPNAEGAASQAQSGMRRACCWVAAPKEKFSSDERAAYLRNEAHWQRLHLMEHTLGLVPPYERTP